MAIKHKSLYLYLAFACFLGIILVFVFDGYIGVYDRLVMDNGQYPQRLDADQWSEDRYQYLASTGVESGGRVDFTYTVENHQFSKYTADIEVSFLHNREKIGGVSGNLTAAAFNEGNFEWTIYTTEVIPPDYPSDQNYNVNVIIKRGGTEREVIINIFPSATPLKPVIAPSR